MTDWPALASLAAAGLAAVLAAAGLVALSRARRAQQGELRALRAVIDEAVARARPAQEADAPSDSSLATVAEALRDDLDHMFLFVSRLSDTVRGEIAPLTERMAAIERGFVSAVGEGPERERLAAIEGRIDDAAEAQMRRIETVSGTLETVRGRIDALGAEVSALGGRIGDAAEAARRRDGERQTREEAARQAAAGAIEDLDARIGERLERLDRAVGQTAKATAAAEARLGERLSAAPEIVLGPRLDRLERRLAILCDGDGDGGAAAMTERLDGLARAVAELRAETTALADRIETATAGSGRDAVAADLAALTRETSAARTAALRAAAAAEALSAADRDRQRPAPAAADAPPEAPTAPDEAGAASGRAETEALPPPRPGPTEEKAGGGPALRAIPGGTDARARTPAAAPQDRPRPTAETLANPQADERASARPRSDAADQAVAVADADGPSHPADAKTRRRAGRIVDLA